jgi:phage terminase large subunit-like protein
VLQDAATFDLRECNVDKKFQGQQLVNELQAEGLLLFTFGQGWSAWAGPMGETMRLYKAHKIHHGGNPILRWAADNLEVKVGEQGDMIPVKGAGQKRRKIDPFVAMVMGIDRKIRHSDDEETSAYEDRRVIFMPF